MYSSLVLPVAITTIIGYTMWKPYRAKYNHVVLHMLCMVFSKMDMRMSCEGTSLSLGESLPVRRGKTGPDPKPPAPPPSMAPPPKSDSQAIPMPAGAEAQAPLPGRITSIAQEIIKGEYRNQTANFSALLGVLSCTGYRQLCNATPGLSHNRGNPMGFPNPQKNSEM